MNKNITDLLEGEVAVVSDCTCHRLLEHGFVPGTRIIIYKKFSEITSVYLRGAVIAARNNDYQKVTVNGLPALEKSSSE